MNHLITRAKRLIYTRLSPTKLNSRMLQHKWYRMLATGTFVRFYGKWRDAEVVLTMMDGTRCLRIHGCSMVAPDEAVHETFPGIETIEIWG